MFREITALIQHGHSEDAVRALEADQHPGKLAPQRAVLLAWALQGLRRLDDATEVLRAAIAAGNADRWTFDRLAAIRREAGDFEGTAEAYRAVHQDMGWSESKANGYWFSHDFFAANVETWNRWFAEHITRAPIQILEIGSWQGGSATWLLDRVIGPRGGHLTCVDTFEGSSEHAGLRSALERAAPPLGDGSSPWPIERLFDANIARTGKAGAVTKIRGTSQDVLRRMVDNRFDLIYVDGAHEAGMVIQDAVLAWSLLDAGGFLLFDDVLFTFPDRPAQDTARAVDFFVGVFGKELTVIERGRQLLLRRETANPPSPGGMQPRDPERVAERVQTPTEARPEAGPAARLPVERQLIFDIGPCEGNDSHFYLRKGFRVVAVEANPIMAAQLQARFATEITARQSVILNRVAHEFANTRMDVWITPDPGHVTAGHNPHRATDSRSVLTVDWPTLIAATGVPYFCKIDIEGAEEAFLRSMLRSPGRPTFISVEVHTVEPIALLFALGYRRFRLINQTFHQWFEPPNPPREGTYVKDGSVRHVSGLFGEELPGSRWFSLTEVLSQMEAIARLRGPDELHRSWYDCHAWMPE